MGAYWDDYQFYSEDWEDEEALRQLCASETRGVELRSRHTRQNELRSAQAARYLL
jgi:hypothetical protein